MPLERNLFANPACALDATGWVSTPAGWARSTTVNPGLARGTGFEGTTAVDINSPRAQVTAGQQYVFSFDIAALTDQSFNALVNFYAEASEGAYVGNSGSTVPVVVDGGTTARIVMGPYTVPAGAVSGHIKWNDIDAGGAEITAIRCAPSSGNLAVDGAYFDGASPGASWDGTAGASTSTRRTFRTAAAAADTFSVVATASGPVATEQVRAADTFSISVSGVIADTVYARDGFLIAAVAFDAVRGRVRIEAFTFTEQVTTARVRRRPVGGRWVDVRGGTVAVAGGLMARMVDDYEYPAGVDVEYLIEGLDDTARVWQSAVVPRAVEADEPAWLKVIANPSLNRRIDIIDTPPQISRDSNAETFRVSGRSEPVVVSDVHSSRQVAVQVVCHSAAEADALDDALAGGHAIFLQVPRGRQLPSMYATVGGYSWQPPTRRSQRWIFTLPLTEVEAPPPSVQPRGRTYADLLAEHASYADLFDAYDTYRELAD